MEYFLIGSIKDEFVDDVETLMTLYFGDEPTVFDDLNMQIHLKSDHDSKKNLVLELSKSRLHIAERIPLRSIGKCTTIGHPRSVNVRHMTEAKCTNTIFEFLFRMGGNVGITYISKGFEYEINDYKVTVSKIFSINAETKTSTNVKMSQTINSSINMQMNLPSNIKDFQGRRLDGVNEMTGNLTMGQKIYQNCKNMDTKCLSIALENGLNVKASGFEQNSSPFMIRQNMPDLEISKSVPINNIEKFQLASNNIHYSNNSSKYKILTSRRPVLEEVSESFRKSSNLEFLRNEPPKPDSLNCESFNTANSKFLTNVPRPFFNYELDSDSDSWIDFKSSNKENFRANTLDSKLLPNLNKCHSGLIMRPLLRNEKISELNYPFKVTPNNPNLGNNTFRKGAYLGESTLPNTNPTTNTTNMTGIQQENTKTASYLDDDDDEMLGPSDSIQKTIDKIILESDPEFGDLIHKIYEKIPEENEIQPQTKRHSESTEEIPKVHRKRRRYHDIKEPDSITDSHLVKISYTGSSDEKSIIEQLHEIASKFNSLINFTDC